MRGVKCVRKLVGVEQRCGSARDVYKGIGMDTKRAVKGYVRLRENRGRRLHRGRKIHNVECVQSARVALGRYQDQLSGIWPQAYVCCLQPYPDKAEELPRKTRIKLRKQIGTPLEKSLNIFCVLS